MNQDIIQRTFGDNTPSLFQRINDGLKNHKKIIAVSGIALAIIALSAIVLTLYFVPGFDKVGDGLKNLVENRKFEEVMAATGISLAGTLVLFGSAGLALLCYRKWPAKEKELTVDETQGSYYSNPKQEDPDYKEETEKNKQDVDPEKPLIEL